MFGERQPAVADQVQTLLDLGQPVDGPSLPQGQLGRGPRGGCR